MSYNPVSGAAIQYEKSNGQVADGYYLKFYIANTTTPLSMATDATGGTLLAKCKLNDRGYPITNPLDNETIFIPYVDRNYRFVLYKNETDADNNTTANADVNIPEIPPLTSTSGVVTNINSVAGFFGLSGIVTGQQVSVKGYYTGETKGGGLFTWGTGTHNGGTFIDPLRAVPDTSVKAEMDAYYATTGGTVSGWQRSNEYDIDTTMFGISGAFTAVINSVPFQAAVNYCCNNAVPLVNPIVQFDSTAITTPNGTSFILRGLSTGFKKFTNGKISEIRFIGTAATISYLVTCGTNAHIDVTGNIFRTSNEAEQWGILKVDTLGAGTATQNANDGTFLIEHNSWIEIGGTCLSMGGECYGTIQRNSGSLIGQFLALNGSGEVNVTDNQIGSFINSSFVPESGSADAVISITETVVKCSKNVMADSEDHRNLYQFDECGSISFSENKSERPGVTAPQQDILVINNAAEVCRALDINHNQFVSSSATGTFTGRSIRTTGTTNQIYQMSVGGGNIFTYGSGATDGHIDMTAHVPRELYLGSNFREGAKAALAVYPDPTASPRTALLGGLTGGSIKYITVKSQEFTILASQTGTTVPFDFQNIVVLMQDNLLQILPASISIQIDAAAGDTVSFYLSSDTTKADAVTVSSAIQRVQGRYALRSEYIITPDYLSDTIIQMKYDSGASASTTVKYSIEFTYAVINDTETSRLDAHLIDVV